MDPYERSKLSDAIQEARYKKGDYILKEGVTGKMFYILSEGTCDATKLLEGKSEPSVVMQY